MHRKGWAIPITTCIVLSMFLLQYTSGVTTITTSATMPDIAENGIPAVITEVKVSHSSTDIEATLQDNDWVFNTGDRANSMYIFELIWRFADIFPSDKIEGDPSLYTYGVYPNNKTIMFSDGGDDSFTLMQGALASESQYYAYHLESNCIYLVDRHYFDMLSTDMNDWRSKDIINFDHATQLTVSANNMIHNIFLDEEDVASLLSLTDEEYLSLIRFLSNAVIGDYITNQATDEILAMYSLDKPQASITLFYDDGTDLTLDLVANPFNPSELYCTIPGSTDIFTLPSMF